MTQVQTVSTPPSTLGLMSCVRESSPPLETSSPEIVRHESKRRRFNPLNGLRRIFRKKSRASSTSTDHAGPPLSGDTHDPDSLLAGDQLSPADPLRSRSTSQLSDAAAAATGDPTSLKNRTHHSALLSLSHDSVFTAESGGSEVDATSCLSVQKAAQSSVRAELLDVVRRRKLQREDLSDDEDLGLPRSPLSSSPHHKTSTTNHSTCSEGSLLSMGSSELEDDSGVHNQTIGSSRQSSKVSVYEKKLTITHDSDAELNISINLPSVPKLSHSAAKHKMAVRPKRTHGAPRKRKHQIGAVTALPATPEVNEDTSSARTPLSDTDSILDDAPPTYPNLEPSKGLSNEQLDKVHSPPALALSQAKSSSLPAGAVPPTAGRLGRSRSNVTPALPAAGEGVKPSLSDDYLDASARKDDGFFSRLLHRRSGKKKKVEEEEEGALPPVIPNKRMNEKGQYTVDVANISSKQYPSSRQRMEPLNIPMEEGGVAPVNRMHVSYVTSLPDDTMEVDSIQVVQPHPEPYMLRMYSQGEFQPVRAFNYTSNQQEASSSRSASPDQEQPLGVTMPEIHTAPEWKGSSSNVEQNELKDLESKDVLVDETVIESGVEVEQLIESQDQIVISHMTMADKPNIPQKPVKPSPGNQKPVATVLPSESNKPAVNQKPIACVIPVRPHSYETPSSQVSKVFLNTTTATTVDSVDIQAEEFSKHGNQNDRSPKHISHAYTDDLIKYDQNILANEDDNKIKQTNDALQEDRIKSIAIQDDIEPEPSTGDSILDFPKQSSANSGHPRDRIQHLSLNLVNAPDKEIIPYPRKSAASSPLGDGSPLKSRSPIKDAPKDSPISPISSQAISPRSPLKDVSSSPPSPLKQRSPLKDAPPGSPRSPLKDAPSSPLKQRSPLKEICPFKVTDSVSPFLSRRLSGRTPSPVTPRKELSAFIPSPDSSPPVQEGVKIPSPVIPKDLVLPVEKSPTKMKESLFSKEIPSPIMPKDVFQFNTAGNTMGHTVSSSRIPPLVPSGENKIGKSASFTEIKKEMPVPAPRTSLRKDNSLPAMPEYMKVHVSTTHAQDTKKSMSSSCESLDMQDQVQSSSYSDSCDSIDNLDPWRSSEKNTQWRKKETPWRNRYSEVSSSDSDDKQLSITPDGSDIEKKVEEEEISIVQLRRKSFTKDWSLGQEQSPRPLRQKSLEPELLKKESANMNEVVLRRKSLSKELVKNSTESDEPELLKVFARRSLKIPKDFDVNDNSIDFNNIKIVTKDQSDKENEVDEKNENINNNENINSVFPLDNDKLKLKKNYESIIISTNKTLDNEDKTKTKQKELKPFNSNVKVNINETVKTVVKTVNINSEDNSKTVATSETDKETNNVNKTEVVDNMKGFKKIQQRREEWEQRMNQARKTQP
uniref:DUF4592 domain-containing protein n=1 Tax=Cacopsylla melanoneura TaxID=428564 RepID=A0A8D8UBA8_9HEMI